MLKINGLSQGYKIYPKQPGGSYQNDTKVRMVRSIGRLWHPPGI